MEINLKGKWKKMIYSKKELFLIIMDRLLLEILTKIIKEKLVYTNMKMVIVFRVNFIQTKKEIINKVNF